MPLYAPRSNLAGLKARIPCHQSVEKVRRPTSLNQRTSVLSTPFRCRPALETAPEKEESPRKRSATMRVHSAALALAVLASVTASSNVLDCTASSESLEASNSTTRTWTCTGVAGTRQIHSIPRFGQAADQLDRRIKRQETSTGNSDGASSSSTGTTAASTSDSAASTTTTTTQAAQTTATTQSPAQPTTTPAQSSSSSSVQSPTTTASPPAQQTTTAQPITTTSVPAQDQTTATAPASTTTTTEGAPNLPNSLSNRKEC